ncbi:MAG: dUTP diphosphatase [Campylobacterales bacterium]|nr:dUTP diphosphatase [Campylobacterales bacterium]
MDKILLMLQLQNQLNDSTNGEDWVKGVTKNGKTINWQRCIYMECAEIIDSFSWKHWKNINQEPDWANLQIEVVDIWHFVMSLAIENYSKNLKGGIEELALNISSFDNLLKIDGESSEFASEDEVMEKVEEIMAIVLDKNSDNIEKLIKQFFELVVMSSLNLQTLYKLYVGKNILNQFRQDNGYKDGTYIKVWGGEEDNVIMKRIWEEHENISPDGLYRELTKLYLAFNKK